MTNIDSLPNISSSDDLERMVLRYGFLPFFRNHIEGFSVQEMTPDNLWFNENVDGPWEWKGPVIRNWQCAYGKIYRGKAGYISLEWLPHLINYRRAHYDLTAAPCDDDGVNREKLIYDTIVEHESLLSRELKRLCPFDDKKSKSSTDHYIDDVAEKRLGRKTARKRSGVTHDTALGRLMMSTLVVITDFEYLMDKHDRPYGWGLARYSTPEAMYAEELEEVMKNLPSPEESFEMMVDHLAQFLPNATTQQIIKLLEIK